MKWILNRFPRTFLIRASIGLRPLLDLYFKGNRYTDPINQKSYRKFLDYGYHNLRKNVLCPGTLSLERHRLLWLYLERKTNFFNQSLRVLHLAPEQAFYKAFKQIEQWEYITADLNSPLAEVQADICELPFQDNSFDLIFCNHVLEHIPDDRKAIRELFRVLKPGGGAFLQVPMEQERESTFEDNTITDPEERAQIFGQYDHVRIYGKDFLNRLEAVGFKVQGIDFTQELTPEEIQTYVLPEGEWIPWAQKPQS